MLIVLYWSDDFQKFHLIPFKVAAVEHSCINIQDLILSSSMLQNIFNVRLDSGVIHSYDSKWHAVYLVQKHFFRINKEIYWWYPRGAGVINLYPNPRSRLHRTLGIQTTEPFSGAGPFKRRQWKWRGIFPAFQPSIDATFTYGSKGTTEHESSSTYPHVWATCFAIGKQSRARRDRFLFWNYYSAARLPNIR